ncbi:MAG: SDR family NAD(P)-dependent oxidoreductase [Planctomycetia bacterium]|nr:SDR family NAD(P)-dependent oxidoreductase [Planctomycetia bacterium]
MLIRNHVFFISGGASGLGAACARRFAAGGGRVLLADVNAAAGETLQAEIGSQARFVKTDVTSPESVAAAVEIAARDLGGIHAAINCAGIALGQRVLGKDGPHDLEAFHRVLKVNLLGTFNVIRLAAAQMSKQPAEEDGERGVIINTASCAAFEGQIGQAAYSASKAGVAGMTIPIARELARFGIRVCTIAPGTFDTPMMGTMTPELKQSLVSQIPFPQRLGRPEEYAALAQHIVENRMLNGAVIRLDGALRMGAK